MLFNFLDRKGIAMSVAIFKAEFSTREIYIYSDQFKYNISRDISLSLRFMFHLPNFLISKYIWVIYLSLKPIAKYWETKNNAYVHTRVHILLNKYYPAGFEGY